MTESKKQLQKKEEIFKDKVRKILSEYLLKKQKKFQRVF